MDEVFGAIPFRPGGRGFDGADCWGLVRLYLGERLGVDLPRYDGEPEDVAAPLASDMEGWPTVERARARVGDVLWLRVLGRPTHVGVVVAPRYMLHTLPSTGPRVERFDVQPWVPHRIISIRRPPGLT